MRPLVASYTERVDPRNNARRAIRFVSEVVVGGRRAFPGRDAKSPERPERIARSRHYRDEASQGGSKPSGSAEPVGEQTLGLDLLGLKF
jgi:hypothetical protein